MIANPLPEILADQNPWWRSGAARRALSYPRRRELQHQLLSRLQRLDERRAVVVRGPRQVGKTVMLLQVADDLLEAGWPPANLLYFDFSDERLQADASPRQVAAVRPGGFDPGHPRALLLDEIAQAPEWARWLKQAVDAGDRTRIAATDSAAALLRTGGEESGQGRWDELQCEGLSLRDFAVLHAQDGESVISVLRRDPGLVERYLVVGGFPEHAMSRDLTEVRRRLRGDIAGRAIRRDLARHVVDVQQVERLFAYLAESSGAEFKVAERARDLEADPRSIRQWLDLLTSTLLVTRLEQHRLKPAARLRSVAKIHAADPGIASAFAPMADDAGTRGRLFEAAVFRHLRDVARELDGEIGYLRGPDGLEIDFVLSSRQRVVGIEVTSATRVRPEKLDRLRRAGRRAGAGRLLLIHGAPAAPPAAGIAQPGLLQFLADPLRAVLGEEAQE
jgi:predicted AAA+ superfamily ATPase